MHSRPNGFLHDWHRPREGKASRDAQMCQPGTAGQVGRYTCCLIKSLLIQRTGVSICISQHWERRLNSKLESRARWHVPVMPALGRGAMAGLWVCALHPDPARLWHQDSVFKKIERKEREKEKGCIFHGLSLPPPLHHSQILKAWNFLVMNVRVEFLP